MPPPAKKRKFLSLHDKAAIIAEVEKGRKKDNAKEYGIACSSLSTVLKGKDAILAALDKDARAQNKTVAAAAFPDVVRAVFAWFFEQRANRVPLSGKILQQEALNFASILGHDQF
ncbi:hypothetical protein HPB51_025797 [Rhipicephalus microplus]|uniref:Tick transposon n=1 Tax=Rhipicephalus microplus TaxID=6941 RepID=A0A9J6DDV1_RHIMP|nr:hypothetical protein HPB51_025797 [Rhipicephalus microplus]